MYSKLASHKFCNSLMARHYKVCASLAASPYLVPPPSSLVPPAPFHTPTELIESNADDAVFHFDRTSPVTACQYVRRKARGLSGAQISRLDLQVAVCLSS